MKRMIKLIAALAITFIVGFGSISFAHDTTMTTTDSEKAELDFYRNSR